MSKRRIVVFASVLTVIALALVGVLGYRLYKDISLFRQQPDLEGDWLLLSFRSNDLAAKSGIVVDKSDGGFAVIWNLSSKESAGTISFEGVQASRITVSSSDDPTEGYVVYAQFSNAPIRGEPRIRIGGRTYFLTRVDAFTDSAIYVSPECAGRGLVNRARGLSHPSKAVARVFTPTQEDQGRTDVRIEPQPMYIDSWFVQGRWTGTVAYFDSQGESDIARIVR